MKSSDSTPPSSVSSLPLDWTNLLFIGLNSLAALTLAPAHAIFVGVPWQTWVFALIFAGVTNLSITAGYHRHYSHRSYDISPLLHYFYLFFGSTAFQGSLLQWCSDHRKHHLQEDSEKDPYAITKGFWFAHVGWLFFKSNDRKIERVADLEKKSLVRLQNKYYGWIAFLSGFVFPALVASLWGDALGGLLVAGCLRIFLTQQTTFFVNSLSHYMGHRPYSLAVSARDNILVSFLTHGEGYHNFHHAFQFDFRNGIRWYHWDPTKWFIQTMAHMGLSWNLKTAPAFEILKAKMHTLEADLLNKGQCSEHLASLRERIFEAQKRLKTLNESWKERSEGHYKKLMLDMRLASIEYQALVKQYFRSVRATRTLGSQRF